MNQNNAINGTKILIVDDIAENVKLIGKLLKVFDVRISVATNGEQAVEVAKQLLPDLILMDVNMPVMNGFEATKKLKEDPNTEKIPIIFLTALNDVNDVVQGFDEGGVDYVTKPFNAKVLLSRINTHLSIKFQREKLEKLNKELEASDIQKTKFLSIVSHDLRSPMTGLIGLSDVMIKDLEILSKDDLKDYLVALNESLKNQYKFLENMLRWGNLQFNKVPLNKELHKTSDLVNEICKVLELNASNKGVKIIQDVQAKEVFGDFNLLYSILHNLTVNAIKYTPENGEVRIRVEEDGDFVRFSVKDTGIGMPKEVAEKLFRVDSVQSRPGTNNEQGTGLGLIVTLESVKKHNGEIHVETQENEGSEFIFTIQKQI